MKGAAVLFNDCLLALDEISECDPREVGAIVYALGNGRGKQRASRTGAAWGVARWLSDAIKGTAATHYGHAGPAFLERLTRDKRDSCALLERFKGLSEFDAADGEGQRGGDFAPEALAAAVDRPAITGDAVVRRADGRILHVRKATRAEPAQLAIIEALGSDPTQEGYRKWSSNPLRVRNFAAVVPLTEFVRCKRMILRKK